MRSTRIGTATGWWGDKLDASHVLLERGDINYLCSDMLAELTLAIHQRIKARNPKLGYVNQIIPFFEQDLKLAVEKNVKIICNGGAANPEGAADVVAGIAKKQGIKKLRQGVIVGDDIMSRLDDIRKKGWKFTNLDTGEQDIDRVRDRIVAANVYTGSDKVIEGIGEKCDVILAGRLSDNSLDVGPAMYELGYKFTPEYTNKIASMITMAHLIECSSAVTGHNSSIWRQVPEPWKVGHPIAECYENGEFIITKPPQTGGLVAYQTLRDHLVYEVHDPNNYIMPDGIADFTSVQLHDLGDNRVRVTDVVGKPRPDTLKVCIGYKDGFITETGCYVSWPDTWEKAQLVAECIWKRAKDVYHIKTENMMVDFVGVNSYCGPTYFTPKEDLNEVHIRIAVKTDTEEEAEQVRALGGDVAGCPVAAGGGFHTPMGTRPVMTLWPCLVPRSEVIEKLIIKDLE